MRYTKSLAKLVSAFVLIFAFASTAEAQLPSLGHGMQRKAEAPVNWSASAKMTSATEGVVTITAKVGKSWHFYGLTAPKGGPKPTTFSFDGSTGVKFKGNIKPSRAALSVNDEMFGKKLSYWDKDVTFTRHFTIDKAHKGERTVKITISYMACDNTNCTPPKTVNLTAKVAAK